VVTRIYTIKSTANLTARTNLWSLSCPEGYKRKMVELRIYSAAEGTVYVKREAEDLAEINTVIPKNFLKPNVVDKEITYGQVLYVDAAGDYSVNPLYVEVTIEETPT